VSEVSFSDLEEMALITVMMVIVAALASMASAFIPPDHLRLGKTKRQTVSEIFLSLTLSLSALSPSKLLFLFPPPSLYTHTLSPSAIITSVSLRGAA
jgi:hypothetical protein